jgi:hypothetical protein
VTRITVRIAALTQVILLITFPGYPRALDTRDPEAVARAFLGALADRRIDDAAQLVAPADREAFRRELSNAPPIPRNVLLRVTVKGERADVDVLNVPNLGLDLAFSDGAWWVVK